MAVKNSFFRKILVSVKFVSAILGPEMGASILWTPGKMRSFCRKTHVHKIPRLGGGYFGFWGGGGVCRFYFYGHADFSDFFVWGWSFWGWPYLPQLLERKASESPCVHCSAFAAARVEVRGAQAASMIFLSDGVAKRKTDAKALSRAPGGGAACECRATL